MRIPELKDISPSTICSRLARIFRRVDLPAPLGPMRPMRSPEWMLIDRFLNRRVLLYDLWMFCVEISVEGVTRTTFDYCFKRVTKIKLMNQYNRDYRICYLCKEIIDKPNLLKNYGRMMSPR